MKMNLKKTLLIGITTILCATSLASCGSVKLQSGENGLYDKKNDISYSHASPVYEATSLLKEYGKLAVTDSESYTLFTIPGADPTEMLATEDFNIIYASSMDMPTLSEMAPSVLRICKNSIETTRLDDADAVAALVKEYTEGVSIPYPGTTPVRSYKVRFESLRYAGFYYTLTYVEYAEDLIIDETNHGKYFLYNAFDKRCVPVGDGIHAALDLTQPEA
ncbi:MAG: hypothetical protein E7610_05335 [Ruminococcaceae bacterium]|nr:hypothetical protein [Oscillospiraceae bacterium]